MSKLTTHVLDTARGRPAADIGVRCDRLVEGEWQHVASGRTDADGRIGDLLPAAESLPPGTYRLTFDTAGYFTATGVEGFYPEVAVLFTVAADEHHHVPLLLSPYGYATYRGS